MFVDINSAWSAPLRRIYLVWGLVLITGFILSGYGYFDGYLHWYVLSLIGLASQIVRMRLNTWKPKFFLIMWAVVALGGTFENHAIMSGLIDPPFGELSYHFQFFWLIIMSVPQFITGYLLKNKFQMGLGVVWLILGVLLLSNTQDDLFSFIFVALVTGLPYLYIAFKR